MHARKTRQRKKEHIQNLQNRADTLKEEQLKLRQVINEKNTASILVGLFATEDKKEGAKVDPEIERLLLRPADDIPDATKVPELPALHLPGQSKKQVKGGAFAVEVTTDLTQAQHELPDDGIDYALLGKDRSQCTPAELDKIRRERNRMHAKRTRDRKRIFMEEMEGIIKKLEQENELLREHLISLGGELDEIAADSTPLLASPSFQASKSTPTSPPDSLLKPAAIDASSSAGIQIAANHFRSLLMASGTFEKEVGSGLMTISSVASAVSSSSNVSANSSLADQDEARSLSPRSLPPKKRQRLDHGARSSGGLPRSITTMAKPGTAIGV
jgi:hypothetical protein